MNSEKPYCGPGLQIGIDLKTMGPVVAFRAPTLFGIAPLILVTTIGPAERRNTHLLDAKPLSATSGTCEGAADVWVECNVRQAREVAHQLLRRRLNKRTVEVGSPYLAQLNQVDLILGQ